MTDKLQADQVFATTTVVSGDLHHRLLTRPGMQAMVVIPTSVHDHGKENDPEFFFVGHLCMYLLEQGISCLLTEIITPKEDADHRYRMDEELHTRRLLFALNQTEQQYSIPHRPTGLAGIGARGVCCLLAARRFPDRVQAVANVDLPPDDQARFTNKLRIPVRFENPGTINSHPSTLRAAYQDCARHLACWFRRNLEKKSLTFASDPLQATSVLS